MRFVVVSFPKIRSSSYGAIGHVPDFNVYGPYNSRADAETALNEKISPSLPEGYSLGVKPVITEQVGK
jgi:hypothetical protein